MTPDMVTDVATAALALAGLGACALTARTLTLLERAARRTLAATREAGNARAEADLWRRRAQSLGWTDPGDQRLPSLPAAGPRYPVRDTT